MIVQLASNYEQCEIFSSILLDANPIVLGFDTETTILRKEDTGYISTIQLSTDKICYIFQIYKIYKDSGRLSRDLIKILQSSNIIKIGVDLIQDTNNLLCYGINLRGTIDIQCIAKTMMINDISLEGLALKFVPELSGKDVLKLNWNWDNDLTEKQIQYAAKDAYLSLQIYQKMLMGVTITTNTSVEDPGAEDYLEWIQRIPKSNPIKINKLVNQTVNSYGPWAKRYTKMEKVELATKLITNFIDEGFL